MKLDLIRLTNDSLVMLIPKSATQEEIDILKQVMQPLAVYCNNAGQTCFTLARLVSDKDHFVSQFEKTQKKRENKLTKK